MSVEEIGERKPLKIKNFGIWLLNCSKKIPCMVYSFIYISRSVRPPHISTILMIKPVLLLIANVLRF
jgi:hypothetical protein